MFPIMHQSRNRAGFTFIEMMIVLAILSLIGTAVVITLNNGISIWQQLSLAAGHEDVSVFLERFSRELRNTFEFSKISFRGGPDAVGFPTFVITPGSSLPQQTGIGQVIYSYDKASGQLSRQGRNFSQIYQGRDGSSQQLLNRINSLRFSYYFYDQMAKEYIWLEEWQGQGLPLAVRIELESSNGPQTKRITRTIDIPIAKLPKDY